MADSLDSSLSRSLVLGRQVLERASRHRVDWTRIRAEGHGLQPTPGGGRGAPPASGQGRVRGNTQQEAKELRAAFASISSFMIQTTAHCQRYHSSLPALTDPEERHVRRFHASGGRRPDVAMETQGKAPHWGFTEDFFHVQVQPGTYSVSASEPQAPRQQTQQVSLSDGESVLLTFHL